MDAKVSKKAIRLVIDLGTLASLAHALTTGILMETCFKMEPLNELQPIL